MGEIFYQAGKTESGTAEERLGEDGWTLGWELMHRLEDYSSVALYFLCWFIIDLQYPAITSATVHPELLLLHQ